MESLDKVLNKALEFYREGDEEKAQAWINQHFGEDVDLSIVKCEICGEVLALVENILAKTLIGGDKRANLAVYKHIKNHPTHIESIFGYSHGVKLPLGSTLFYGIERQPSWLLEKLRPVLDYFPKHKRGGLKGAAEYHGLTIDEALRSRIEHLETKLGVSIDDKKET